MRYAENNPTIVAEFKQLVSSSNPPIVCSINLGEVHYSLARRDGFVKADDMWDRVCGFAAVEPPTLAVTRRASQLVVSNRIPWADAHAAATALAHNAVVWAGDEHLNKPTPLILKNNLSTIRGEAQPTTATGK